MKCPKCGKEIAEGSKFCEFCGAKVKKATKKWVMWLVGGLVVAILAVAMILVMSKDSEYVDLGLPSGTKWKSSVESGFFNYKEAKNKFGDQLPAKAQFNELIDKCDWEWDGSGYTVTGPNGKSIYLSAKGIYVPFDKQVEEIGESGVFWSSTYSKSAEGPYVLTIYKKNEYGNGQTIEEGFDPTFGFSVILVK